MPAYAAMAAEMGQELTIPEIAQSIVLTRMSMQSTSMPENETLNNFGKTGATLAIHLAVRNMREIERQLVPHYGEDCPVVVGYRVGWPDQLIIRGTLSDIRKKIRKENLSYEVPWFHRIFGARACPVLLNTVYTINYRLKASVELHGHVVLNLAVEELKSIQLYSYGCILIITILFRTEY